MAEIKILARYDGTEEPHGAYGRPNCFLKRLISEQTEEENGVKVPKYEILIASKHPKIEELEKERIGLEEFETNQNYSYEISFDEDDKSLLLRLPRGGRTEIRNEDKRVRIFFPENNIAIKDNSYSNKLKELKSLNNLIPGEEKKWKDFIASFRQELNQLTNEDTSKYQKSKEFIEELEAEFNKKSGKDNDDSKRERERERERESKIAKLRKWIAKLEAIVNRTAEQEQELQDKKRELAQLESQQQNGGGGDPKKPTNYLTWILVALVILLLVGIIIYLLTRGEKGKRKV